MIILGEVVKGCGGNAARVTVGKLLLISVQVLDIIALIALTRREGVSNKRPQPKGVDP